MIITDKETKRKIDQKETDREIMEREREQEIWTRRDLVSRNASLVLPCT